MIVWSFPLSNLGWFRLANICHMEHLPSFGSPTSSTPRLGADKRRPVILGVGGIFLNASCSLLLTELENHLALLCAFPTDAFTR